MKKEDLTALGITEEQIKGVLKLSEAETKTLNEEISILKSENKTLEEKKGKGGIDEKELERIKKAAFDEGKAAVQKEFDGYKYEQALTSELKKFGAKNEKAVKALLDMDSIKYENGSFSGLSDQLEALKKDNDFLFDIAAPEKKPTFAGKTSGGSEITKESFDKMGYREKTKLFQENPELYKQLSDKE